MALVKKMFSVFLGLTLIFGFTPATSALAAQTAEAGNENAEQQSTESKPTDSSHVSPLGANEQQEPLFQEESVETIADPPINEEEQEQDGASVGED